MDVTCRPMRATDGPLLPGMLAMALDWAPGAEVRPASAVLADPLLARYVEDWPHPGDLGVVAEILDHADGPEGEPNVVGAAWLRHFPASAPSYGFVDEATPELAIAVAHGWRGQGVGRAMLAGLIREARSAGVEHFSLSVRLANPAMRLYEQVGFEVVRQEGESATMQLRL